MQPLTVVLWLWAKGWRASTYTAEHVNTAARMVSDNLSLPHRVVCLTDMPAGITACEALPIWPELPKLVTAGRPNCWRRIRLFEPKTAAKIGQRIVSMDLDMVVMRDLAPLFDHTEPFKILRGHYAAYNGSLWQMDAGVHPHVWGNFDPERSPRMARMAKHPRSPERRMVGSDQVWLSMQVPNAPVWAHADGVLSYARDSVTYRHARDARLWFFAGGVKPWSRQTAQLIPKVHGQYMKYWTGPKLPK